MAGDIDTLIRVIQARKKAKEAMRPNPSQDEADSLAVSTERLVRGAASPADSTRLYLAGRLKKPVEARPSDYATAMARIRSGQGDRADSIHVGLQPRAAQPPQTSYSIREGVGPDGQPVFLRANSRTGTLEAAKTGYKPSAGKKEEDPEKEYLGALSRSNDIQGEIARIDNVLNDPNAKDGAEMLDELGNKKYVDRKALATQRTGLAKEQKIHLAKTAAHELSSTLPAAKHNGRTVTDKATGARFRSDGKQWIPITE